MHILCYVAYSLTLYPSLLFTLQLYEIPVIATDGGGRSGFVFVRVPIADENDMEPEFQQRIYKATIQTNLTINTTFLKVIKFLSD